MISTDPLAPGSVYTSSVHDQGKVGLYRLEVGCAPGTGKLKIAGGVDGPMRESINRAFAYMMGQKVKMGIAQLVDTTDFHVEAIDLLSNHVPAEVGIALVVGAADVARAAADLVLLEHDLSVVREAIVYGRSTVQNVSKYVLMGSSSNFGNMFSMAGAALFLPFLPMLPI